MKKLTIIVLQLMFLSGNLFAQVFLAAEEKSDTYTRIISKGWGTETPDCLHKETHITQDWNDELNKYVFTFILHKEIDGDRCERIDRQRNEIKTYGPSPENMKAGHGETHYYRWKFKLDKNFKPSPNFCHIHQLKAGDGPDAGSPIITITPRRSTPDRLELIYTPSSGTSGGGKIKQTDLAPFKGVWIEAIERVVYSDPGEYSLVLKRVSDDKILFEYESDKLDLWREGSTFIRPKLGIYRSLNSSEYLRDEQVLFADISLVEGTTFVEPEAPSNVNQTVNDNGKPFLEWTMNIANEDQFRIDVSSDQGNTWTYLTCAPADTKSLVIENTLIENEIYRIRAENTIGNSEFVIADKNTGLKFDKKSGEHSLKNYPNPFLNETKFTYSIPEKTGVKLVVYDMNGKVLDVLVDNIHEPGNYKLVWKGIQPEVMMGSFYLVELKTAFSSECIKIRKGI